jgi:hypothetical protein
MDHRLFHAVLNLSLRHTLDVAAGAERAPGTRQHDRSDGRVPSQPRQRFKEAFHDGRRERVQPFRPVERQRRDAVRDCFEKMLFHRDAPSLRVLRQIYATRLRLASEQ